MSTSQFENAIEAVSNYFSPSNNKKSTDTPAPFDPAYTATNFTGFAISVDIVNGDKHLGANWQSLSLGSLNLNSNDLEAGGYNRTRFQMLEGLEYTNVTLTRPWTSNQSGWIPMWFAAAADEGPTTVAITINFLDVNGKKQTAIYNFRDAYPVAWNQPDFVAVPSTDTPKRITETLTFSHSGFSNSTNLAPGIDSAEKVQPFRLLVLAGANDGGSALASLTDWTPGGSQASKLNASELAVRNSDGAKRAKAETGNLPSITFWVPPSSLKLSKGANWEVTQSPDALVSGLPTWKGTVPLTIEFDFVLDSNSMDVKTSGSLETDSVLPDVERLLALCEINELMEESGSTAPLVMLLWGDFVSPVSYVGDLSFTFEKFNANGQPIRASGHLLITQFPTKLAPQNPTSGGDQPSRNLELYDGDCLAHVAFRAYQSPSYWRDIAKANGIMDPLRTKSGTNLRIPTKASIPNRSESGRPVDSESKNSIPRTLPPSSLRNPT